MNNLFLTRDVLNIAEIIGKISADTSAEWEIFVGKIHNRSDEKHALPLEFKAYEAMVHKIMEAIFEELRREYRDILNIIIYYRPGLIPEGENTVVIAITSANRETSCKAVDSATKELSKRIPMWKECKEGDMKPLEFHIDMCPIDEKYLVPKHLVQITADEDEIQERIDNFCQSKRNDINLCNIRDYTESQSEEGNVISETCARVNAKMTKQPNSSSHLKVTSVNNKVGPQTRIDYHQILDRLMTSSETNPNLPTNPQTQPTKTLNRSPLIERMETMEEHLNITPLSSSDIHKRLKAMEDRILYLEGISPEYHHFMQNPSNINHHELKEDDTGKNNAASTVRKYSVSDIDALIAHFKSQN